MESLSETELKLKKKAESKAVRLYKNEQRSFLMTSRFNNQTAAENQKFRTISWPDGCVYSSPERISQSIPLQSKLMVLEMNNDINKIIGIGLCINKSFVEQYSVYQDNNYNRYNYIGKYRISREMLDAKEEAVFKALDILCFTGNEHMKRGHGIKMFPAKLSYNCRNVINLTEFIENMFKTRFSKK
jgi:hypothetical protein